MHLKNPPYPSYRQQLKHSTALITINGCSLQSHLPEISPCPSAQHMGIILLVLQKLIKKKNKFFTKGS